MRPGHVCVGRGKETCESLLPLCRTCVTRPTEYEGNTKKRDRMFSASICLISSC